MGWTRPLTACNRVSKRVMNRFSLCTLFLLALGGLSAQRGLAQATLTNSFLSVTVGPTGNITVVDATQSNGPTLLRTDSYVTIRIDGGFSGNVNQAGWDLIWGATARMVHQLMALLSRE